MVHSWPGSRLSEGALASLPAVDLLDRKEEVVLRADLPGLEAAGARIHDISWNRALASLGRLGWDEFQLLNAFVRHGVPTLYPHVQCEVTRLPDRRIRAELTIPPTANGVWSIRLRLSFPGQVTT